MIDAGFNNFRQKHKLATGREYRMRVFLPVLLLTMNLHSTVVDALTPEELQIYERQYHELQYYKLIYSEEIYNYCVNQYGTIEKYANAGPALGGCMARQKKSKDNIFNDATRRLGRRSLVQEIYDACVDFYPENSVARIGECLQTRLVLRQKLEDDSIEKKIYLKCDLKWRKHSFGAIDNCARSQANYYRDNGELSD